MRLKDKVAVVVGAGQTPGDTIGNGRATAVVFAREGARVVVVDRDLGRARDTEEAILAEGGRAMSIEADVTREDDCRRLTHSVLDAHGRIDVLHNNVGIGGGDAGPTGLTEEVWDRVMTVNVKGLFLACKHVLPVMRRQESGSIINISSIAAVCSVGIIAYKSSKAAVNAFSHSLALGNARYGIRVNVIMPGLIDTPMAIEGISRARGISKADLRRERDAQVPLRGRMGTAWDVARAALFLASDEAAFITGAVLPVDGGQSARVG
ncbi:MAG TPA: SDR family NAD(P)-dependent oxidoreductase [Candidatus Methylomirabilis sp.]|nr:SDR family NAD(P)-dependent oxidoreductase [Candidatus Methylomirabilis sp.]